jgi:hypothetical protein
MFKCTKASTITILLLEERESENKNATCLEATKYYFIQFPQRH